MPSLGTPHKGFLVKSYLAHNVIFNEGSQGDTAYLLTEGQVEISTSVGGRKKVLAILNPPSLFGEMALFLEDQTRTATAMTLEDSQMVLISRDALAGYMDDAPQAIASIMQVMVHRLKATTKKAGRVPNVPMGLCRVLHLFQLNDVDRVKYDSVVRLMSETFMVGPETMEGYLEALATKGHIAIKAADSGARYILFLTDNIMQAVMQLTTTHEE